MSTQYPWKINETPEERRRRESVDEEEKNSEKSRNFYKRCQLFDYLISNGDRHGGNVMVFGEQHYVAIDNAFAFSDEHCMGGGPRLNNTKFTKFYLEIERLRSSPILNFLVPLLDSSSLASFVKRLAAIKL